MSNDFQPSTLKFILLMAALRESSPENPKNSNDLIRDVEAAYRELCPDEPVKSIAPATIIRHIKTINKSGYMKINTCKNLKAGYYCDSQLFTAAEFSLIAQALYRSPSLSAGETKTLLDKFLNHIDDSGENYLDILTKQIGRWSPKRKTTRPTLPNIEKITYAIWHQREIAFQCYDLDMSSPENLEVRTEALTRKPIKYRVSPYFLVWDNDECYLIAHALNILLQQRLKIIRPKLIEVQAFQLQKVRRTNLIILVQIIYLGNLPIQRRHTAAGLIDQVLILQGRQCLQLFIRLQLNEPETTAHRKIKTVYRAIDIIHCSNHIDILWYKKFIFRIFMGYRRQNHFPRP